MLETIEIIIMPIIMFIILIIIQTIFGCISDSIGEQKGINGFWWGFFLGVLGIILVGLMPYNPDRQNYKKCKIEIKNNSASKINTINVLLILIIIAIVLFGYLMFASIHNEYEIEEQRAKDLQRQYDDIVRNNDNKELLKELDIE